MSRDSHPADSEALRYFLQDDDDVEDEDDDVDEDGDSDDEDEDEDGDEEEVETWQVLIGRIFPDFS